ncbi:MAG TPA: Rho termination factor N-terminal domain-containing protein, partial [Rhodothermales bacterium]|nr:Rho termination factor N-terminal domain-containing protein [Rhodothermales bacterium]
MKISELQDKKLPDLKEIARGMGLAGYSNMRKQEIIYLILEAQAEAAARSGDGAVRRERESRPHDDRQEASNGEAARNGSPVPEVAVSEAAPQAAGAPNEQRDRQRDRNRNDWKDRRRG